MTGKTKMTKSSASKQLIRQEFNSGKYVDLWESFCKFIANMIEKRFGYRPTNTIIVIGYCLLLGIVDIVISILSRDFSEPRLQLIPLEILLLIINITFILGQIQYSQRFTTTFVKVVLKDMNTEKDKVSLHQSLLFISNRFWPIVLGILFSAGWIWLAPLIVHSSIGETISAGPYFLAIFGTFSVGTSLYAQLFLWIFPLQFRNYDLQLSFFNPASSVLIKVLNRLFSVPILLIALLALEITLAFTIVVYSRIGIVLSIALGWIPVLGIFSLHQFALAQIIARCKNQNLATMEKQILELKNQLSDTDTDKSYGDLLQLLSAHEKLEQSPNSALNKESWKALINALVIPLLSQTLELLSRLWKWLVG